LRNKQAQKEYHNINKRASIASESLGLFNCLSEASCLRRQPSKEIVELLARWE
jgi:hypothetical protein